jgi:hypothetical protein
MTVRRCISSHLTTKVAEFRNPQGKESNWLYKPGKIENYGVHTFKVLSAEAASALLCVTAVIETFAYSFFALMGLLAYPCTDYFLNISIDYLSSSGFTIFWNMGNLIIFNPFCTNITTHESFTRFSMDHMTRGKIFKAVIIGLDIACIFYSIIFKVPYKSKGHLARELVDTPFLRIEDRCYVADWFRTIEAEGGSIPKNINNRLLKDIKERADKDIEILKQGSEFIKDYFLNATEIDEDSHEAIKTSMPDCFEFILARTFFIYIFGDKKNEPLPSFLKHKTIKAIGALRNEYKNNTQLEDAFYPLITSIDNFKNVQLNREVLKAFNDLKGPIYGELRGGFIKYCLSEALNTAGEQKTSKNYFCLSFQRA